MRHKLVPQSQVERQLLAYLEIVLDVIELSRLLEYVVDERRELRVVHDAQQKIGGAQAGIRRVVRIVREVTGEVERAARNGRLQNGKVHPRLEFGADLEGVASTIRLTLSMMW